MANLVFIENGEVFTTSRQVAKDFGKEHKHVLESIREIIRNLTDENSAVSFKNYFIEDSYTSRGKVYPQFKLTKDGFTLLAMGFTGAKALKFKIDYINQFNEMEAQLKEIDLVMNQKSELDEEDYAKVKFSTSQRVTKTFLQSQDIFKDYERFLNYSRKAMDKDMRIKRLHKIIETLKIREDNLYKTKKRGYRAERENIIELTEQILRDIDEINNRSYGQKLRYAKIG
ncbi:Rha family transcriptional regulator [Bacillus sp. FSL W8-0223]|uniref:Rha family transcriptional regulator n=1 Tax=Bacillus sp. FSL W8-0223 TaxID=2954595 RepID=UPI0030F5A1ED